MNFDLLLVLGALIACVGLFIVNKPRMDVVALLVIVILPLTGIISMPEALAGFSDTNVVLIAALFVIGEGLTRTGIAYRLSDHLIGMSGTSEARLLVLLMLAVAGLGSVMSSTGVVAIFVPVSSQCGRAAGRASQAANDGAGLCRLDQRHADIGRHSSEHGGRWRGQGAWLPGLSAALI